MTQEGGKTRQATYEPNIPKDIGMGEEVIGKGLRFLRLHIVRPFPSSNSSYLASGNVAAGNHISNDITKRALNGQAKIRQVFRV